MPKRVPTRCLGIDLALNHAAFVVVQDGQVADYRLVTTKKMIAEVDSSKAHRLVHRNHYDRLHLWGEYLYDVITDLEPDLVAIEDYAYGAGQGAHQIGELGGLLRLTLWDFMIPFKCYSPGTIKKFATGKGNAKKSDMLEASKGLFKQWTPGKDSTTEEDLVDAYYTALLGESDDSEGWIINV